MTSATNIPRGITARIHPHSPLGGENATSSRPFYKTMKAIIDGTVTEISPERWAAFEAFEKGGAKDWPQMGDKIWAITSTGICYQQKYTDEGSIACQSIGNIYRTEAEALAQVEKLKAKARIDKYIKDNGLEFVPDWSDAGESKWWIIYDHEDNALRGDGSSWGQVATVNFASEAHAQQVIDNCTDDLKTLFGI